MEYNDFLNMFNQKFPNVDFEIIEHLENYYVLTKTKYGYCKSSMHHLLNGKHPNIRSAVNKTEYFINKAKEIHGDKYDYSITKFEISTVKIQYICKIHGIVNQSPGCHLAGRGCNKCKYTTISIKNSENESGGYSLTNWETKAKTSKQFDSFKLYIIKCWGNGEEFYKIGRTFTKLKSRFKSIPYNYDIIQITQGDAKNIYNLEIKFKRLNKEDRYLPKIWFAGSQECYSKIKTNNETDI